MKKFVPSLLLILCTLPVNAQVANSTAQEAAPKNYNGDNKNNNGEKIFFNGEKKFFNGDTSAAQSEALAKVAAAYADSLVRLTSRFRTWHYEGDDTLANPFYYPLFTGTTFHHASIHRRIGSIGNAEGAAATEVPYRIAYDATDRQLRRNAYIDGRLTDFYVQHPELIRLDGSRVEATEGLREDIKEDVKPDATLTGRLTTETPAAPADDFDDAWNIVVRKPNFWTLKANFGLQFMQTHVSDNWYKGGESNNSLLAWLNAEANYNNKQKLTFDNKLELKLGFQSSKGDEEHKYKTNTDLIRLTNKLGIQAAKRWYYTLMLQSWTQFCHGYRSNDPKVYSDFLSPLESLLSIGMDYKLNPKNFSLSANIAPLAVHLKYVQRPSLITSFGLDEGKHAKFEFGSNITTTYKWTINKNIQINGRFYYFTDYKKVQIEWENTATLKINKYLSTKLYTMPRFDDSANREPGKSYFQFYENLTVGLDLSF